MKKPRLSKIQQFFQDALAAERNRDLTNAEVNVNLVKCISQHSVNAFVLSLKKDAEINGFITSQSLSKRRKKS